MRLTIVQETLDQDDVTHLLRAADERSASLYPLESRHGLDVESLLRLNVIFFVARRDGQAVGCGGFAQDRHGQAELKRMFVAADARGRGIGGSILHRIETTAIKTGVGLMQLETGIKSVEAIGLYRRFGYRERPAFGSYLPDPLSIFMEKALLPEKIMQGTQGPVRKRPGAVP